MFKGIDTAAKTMLVATVVGVVVATAINYGTKAYDQTKAVREMKKNEGQALKDLHNLKKRNS